MSFADPEWLRSTVAKAGTGLDRKVFATGGSGSDHRVFVQAGVVATDITVAGGAQTHAPTDVPEAVSADSTELAARLVVAVIDDRLCSEPDSDGIEVVSASSADLHSNAPRVFTFQIRISPSAAGAQCWP